MVAIFPFVKKRAIISIAGIASDHVEVIYLITELLQKGALHW